VSPTLRFSREFGYAFFVDLRYFGGLAGCLFLGLFQLKFACFLGLFFADFSFADCFFSNFMALLLFQFIA